MALKRRTHSLNNYVFSKLGSRHFSLFRPFGFASWELKYRQNRHTCTVNGWVIGNRRGVRDRPLLWVGLGRKQLRKRGVNPFHHIGFRTKVFLQPQRFQGYRANAFFLHPQEPGHFGFTKARSEERRGGREG